MAPTTVHELLFVLRGARGGLAANGAAIVEWFVEIATLLRAAGHTVGITGQAEPRVKAWTAEYWQDSTQKMLAGSRRALGVQADTRQVPNERVLAAWVARSERPDVGNVDLYVTFGPTEFMSLQEYIALVRKACGSFGCPQAFIHALGQDLPPFRYPPVQMQARQQKVFFGPLALEAYIEAYGWGVYLTSQHVDKLGGVEKLMQEAPVQNVQQWEAGHFLQLTEDPWRVTAQDLSRLDRYLTPLIPTVEQLRQADPSGHRARQTVGGPALRYTWGQIEGVDVDISVELEQSPNPDAGAALEQVRISGMSNTHFG